MKKRAVRWFVIHAMMALAIAAGVMMFVEEIADVKYAVYNLFEEEAEAQDLSKFDDYPDAMLSEDAWYNQSRMIYHACGGIDGLSYTNSVEALEKTLGSGCRLIEADFGYTTDGALVCVRHWADLSGEDRQLSLAEFKAAKICGKYTPMTAERLLEYMAQHEDMYLIIDTKEGDSISVVRDLAALCDDNADILDHFVIQLYDRGIKAKVQEIYSFPDDNFLFTAYKFGPTRYAEIMELCYEEQISVITVQIGKWDAETIRYFSEKGFLVFNHTVNRMDYVNELTAQGVYGFYTDFLAEEDLPAV